MSTYIVNLLIEERDRLVAAISALQGSASKKRPGRPPVKKAADVYDDPTMPDWVKPKSPAPKKKGMSAAARKRIGEATKARWAKLRAEKAGPVAPKISKKSVILAAVTPSAEDVEFKAKMSAAMKRAWAKRKKAAKNKI
jgi:hypothetical protein